MVSHLLLGLLRVLLLNPPNLFSSAASQSSQQNGDVLLPAGLGVGGEVKTGIERRKSKTDRKLKSTEREAQVWMENSNALLETIADAIERQRLCAAGDETPRAGVRGSPMDLDAPSSSLSSLPSSSRTACL